MVVTSSTRATCTLAESSLPSTNEFVLTKDSHDTANLLASAMLRLNAFWPGRRGVFVMKAVTTQTAATATAHLLIGAFFMLWSELRFAEDAHFPKEFFIGGDFVFVYVDYTVGIFVIGVPLRHEHAVENEGRWNL